MFDIGTPAEIGLDYTYYTYGGEVAVVTRRF
jgi:hypothetical protein